jgi:exodeoxyribonuclease-3
VAHKEIDLKNPKANERNPASPRRAGGFDRIIASGFIDTFREFNREPGNYTWWCTDSTPARGTSAGA